MSEAQTDYKYKYHKYKLKYTNEKMKGGQLSCISNKYRYGYDINRSSYFDIFYIAHELYVKGNYNPILSPSMDVRFNGFENRDTRAFKNLLKNNPAIAHYVDNSFSLFDIIISIYKQYEVRKENSGQQHMYADLNSFERSDTYDNYRKNCDDMDYSSKNKHSRTSTIYTGLELDRENCDIRKFNNSTGMILSSNDILNLCRDKFFSSTPRMLNPPNNQLGLIESVLGNLLNIGCNSQSLDYFISDIQNNCTTEIIDFQNIASILKEYYMTSNKTLSEADCYKHALEQIVKYTYNRIKDDNNYVVIVFKPSRYYQTDRVFGSDFDYIKSMFFGNDIGEYKSDPQQLMYKILGQQLNLRLFFINMSCNQVSSSNYDDFIFWAIAIGFYGIYSISANNNIRNLKLITNDKQVMDGVDNTKNILNFNMCDFINIDHIQYYLDDYQDTNGKTVRKIKTYTSNNTVLKFYLEILHCVLNYDYLKNYTKLSDVSTENINTFVENSIHGNIGLMDVISLENIQNYLVYRYDNGNVKYLAGYIFFALIKYIQWGQFGEEYGSMGRDVIGQLFIQIP